MNINDKFCLTPQTIVIGDEKGTKIYQVEKGGLKKYNCNIDAYNVLFLLQKGLCLNDIINLSARKNCRKKIIDFLSDLENKKIIMHGKAEKENRQIRRVDNNADPTLSRIFLSVTNTCNLKCNHCYNVRIKRPLFMDIVVIEKILEQGYRMGLKQVDITGGECFLHPQILEILKLATDYGMLINIYTNGTLINENLVKALKKFRIMNIIVSLDSLDDSVHDSFRGVIGCHLKTMNTLQIIKNSALNLRINITAMQENESEMERMIDYIYNELMAESIVIAPILESGRGTQSFCMSTTIPQICGYQKMIYKKLDERIAVSKLNSRYKAHCGVGNSMLYIDTDYTVSLCPTLTMYEDKAFLLGNLIKDELKTVFSAMHERGFVEKVLCKNTTECEYADSCRGGCRSRAFLQNKDVSDKDELMCYFYKNCT